MENKTFAFCATELCPLNSEIFRDHTFLSAAVTDIPLNSDENNAQEPP